MKVKEESKKADLKFNIQKHKIMASGRITFMGNRWGNETVTDFIFLGFLGLMLWIVVLEKTLESPLGFKKIKPVNPKGNQSWIFIGRTDAEGEAPILWSPDVKNWLTGKDPDARKDWGQKEKGTAEDEMVR